MSKHNPDTTTIRVSKRTHRHLRAVAGVLVHRTISDVIDLALERLADTDPVVAAVVGTVNTSDVVAS